MTKEEKDLQEVTFYNTPFKFSYSSLNKLLEAPSVFYREYILLDKEIKSERYLVMGSLIHCLLLEPENKDNKFILSPTEIPGGGGKEVIDAIFEHYKTLEVKEGDDAFYTLETFTEQIIYILKEINLHQKLTDDTKRLAKIIDEKNINYFEFLKKKGSRELIDPEMLNDALVAVEVIQNTPELVELLALNKESNETEFAVYNELELSMDLEGLPFGLKGIIDNLTVDALKKEININDFKTMGKSLIHFPESVETWKYWLQASIYHRLVTNYLSQYFDVADGWKVNVNFVVIDKYNQVYAYPVSAKSFALWQEQTDEVIKETLYHYNERNYTLPYKFIAGTVEL